MIKGISILRPAGNADVYARLAGFFDALGFARGPGWKDAESSGASFLAPLGNFEFVLGQFPPVADLMVEVTSLDSTHQAAARWLRADGGDSAATCISEISDTTWQSRIFTVEPEPGFA